MEQQWSRSVLSSIGDAVLTVDVGGVVTFLNPKAEMLLGWLSVDAVGEHARRVFQVVNEADGQLIESALAIAMRDGVSTPPVNHCLLLSRAGVRTPIEHSASPIQASTGGRSGAVLVFRDVSERRAVEEALATSAHFADAIIATLREPFLVLDAKRCVQAANPAFFRAFKVDAQSTIGRALYDLGDRAWDIPQLGALLDLLTPESPMFRDFRVSHDFPGLGERTMLLNAHRLGSPDLILLAIEDVTDRQDAFDALDVSELRYRRLFEAARDGILILNADTGEILDANPFMAELLGYTHAEFVGRQLWEIGVFEDRAQCEAAVRELQKDEYVRYEHLPLQTSRGERVEVEFVSNVYTMRNRRVAQCNIRDIRARRQLEIQGERQAVELQVLDRRKDEFLAMLSHELRNPLAPILNAVELLNMHKDGESLVQQQARTIIGRQAGILKHLVDDLLDVSRMTTGRIRLRREPLSLRNILDGAGQTARPIIDQRRQQLSITMVTEPLTVDGDAVRLEQVFVNLLTNAAKYMDEGGVIRVIAERDGDFGVIRVQDTGIGISADLLPRIFDLFTQADRPMDRTQGGLGIGLSIVQRLVELHGGTVHATSTPGAGSEFVVRLPLASLNSADVKAQEVETTRGASTRIRVLVVDDNIDMARSLSLLVATIGHEVRTVHDGARALRVALDFKPDVVLLDLGLPGLHGYEVAKRLRLQPGGDRMLLIAITGYGQESDRQRSRDEGIDHHLLKPPDFAVLTALLNGAAKAEAAARAGS